jgi:HPt (histidine-containing phosphotransfer) domain-containing protein
MFKVSPEMKKVYLLRRLQDLPFLREDIATSSVEQFHRCGHQIMGNAQSFGFINLEVIAIKMNEITIERLSVDGPGLIEEYNLRVLQNLNSLNS